MVQFLRLSYPEQFLNFACRFADDSGETGSGERVKGLRIEAIARIGIGAVEGKNLGAVAIPGREIGCIDANDAVDGLIAGIDERDKRKRIGFDETRPEAALVFKGKVIELKDDVAKGGEAALCDVTRLSFVGLALFSGKRIRSDDFAQMVGVLFILFAEPLSERAQIDARLSAHRGIRPKDVQNLFLTEVGEKLHLAVDAPGEPVGVGADFFGRKLSQGVRRTVVLARVDQLPDALRGPLVGRRLLRLT